MLLSGIDHCRLRCFGSISRQCVARHKRLRTFCAPAQQCKLFFEKGQNVPVSGNGGVRLVTAKGRFNLLCLKQGKTIAKVRGVLLRHQLTFFDTIAKLQILEVCNGIHGRGNGGHTSGGDPSLYIRKNGQHVFAGFGNTTVAVRPPNWAKAGICAHRIAMPVIRAAMALRAPKD